MTEDKPQFEDAEGFQFGPKNPLDFKMIILMHLKNIGKYSAVEFRGGYWDTKPISVGGAILEHRVYTPDTREVYSNAVEYLHDMLYPHFDEKMRKQSIAAEEKLKAAWEKSTVVKEPDREEEDSVEGSKYDRKFATTKDRVTYRTLRRDINRLLFRALCSFLYRKKYLELGAIED